MEKRRKQKEQESWAGKSGTLIQGRGTGVGGIPRRPKPYLHVVSAYPLTI